MKIRFGMALDGQHSWARESSFNQRTVGPLGLLNILETHLGLTALRPTGAERTIAYRECLKRADNGERFYSASFAIDELGIANALLARRDELFLHGWTGAFSHSNLPCRLLDMAAVEVPARDLQLAPGIGERLTKVREALTLLPVPISQVQVIDKLTTLPLRWREVLKCLPTVFQPLMRTGSAQGSCLARLQSGLADGGETIVEWVDDKSLLVVEAETPLLAAHWVAGWLEQEQERGTTMLVNGGHGGLLDDIVAGRGLPRQGIGHATVLRPALQVLPLAVRLLWAPVDFQSLLAFLALPVAPLRRSIREGLAAAVAASPGFGGPEWTNAVDEACKLSNDAEQVRKDIRFWLQPARFSQQDGIPIERLLERAQSVLEFFQRRLGMDDALQREAAFGGLVQTSAFLLAARALALQSEGHLRPAQVEQLLEQAAPGPSGGAVREARSVAVAGCPGAVCEPADTVIWWWASSPSRFQASPWFEREHVALRAAGVELPSDEERIAWETHSWLVPVLAARKRLVLVVPSATDQRHPLCAAIETLFRRPSEGGMRAALPMARAEAVLVGEPDAFNVSPVAHVPLPTPKRWWDVSGHALTYDRYPLSYSAVSLLLNDPYQWVLRYQARLETSSMLQVSDGPRLYGSLAHRLVEKLVPALNTGSVTAKQLQHWFEREFPLLVEQEGAVLLMPGRGTELAMVKRLMRIALVELVDILTKSGAVRVESECRLEGEFTGGRMMGYADLVLHCAHGETAVVDMKWGSLNHYREALQTRSHLQLVLYAEMLRQQTGKLPVLAYFILRNARLLSDTTGFPGNAAWLGPPVKNTADIWRSFLKTLEWREKQLRQGRVEVVASEAEATVDSVPPEDALQLQPLNPEYNEYRFLAGWEQ